MLLNFCACVRCFKIYINSHVTNCCVSIISIVVRASGGTAAARRRAISSR